MTSNVNSKPVLTVDEMTSLLRQRYGIQPLMVKEYDSYDDRTYYVRTAPGDGLGGRTEFIAKVLNSQFTAIEGAAAVHCDLLKYLSSEFPELHCQCCLPNVDGNLQSYEMIANDIRDGHVLIEQKKVPSALRLFVFLPGKTLTEVSPLLADSFFDIGVHLGKMQQAFQMYPGDVEPLKSKADQAIWNPSSLPKLRDYLPLVADVQKKRMAEDVIEQFEANVLPVMDKLRKGIINSDFNSDNMLVAAQSPDAEQALNGTKYKISGVIDFDDTCYSCLVYEIANSMMYMMFCCNQPLKAAAYMLLGFETIAPLPNEERKLLKVLVAGRFVQSLLIGLFQTRNHPENVYITSTSVKGWMLLDTWWSQTESELQDLCDKVRSMCHSTP